MTKVRKQGWLKLTSAAVLVASSSAVAVTAVRMGVYSTIGPGPGLFPAILAVILGLLTVIWLFLPEPQGDSEPVSRRGLLSVLTVIGGVAAAVFVMDILGFALTVFLLVAINMSVLGRHRLWLVVLLASVTSVGSLYLFQTLLDVLLPRSSIAFLANLGI